MMIHYAETLEHRGKYALTIWPYHAMLGGIGHALVPALEEAIFFHSIARIAQPDFEIKGDKPFTENYSVIGPEVLTGPMGEMLGTHNSKFIQHLQEVDKLIIAGQAKSHCVAWTVSDLLEDIQAIDPALTRKVYLLEDCTSPVVVPGVVDHTDAANAAYERFAKAGMKIVKSTEHILHRFKGLSQRNPCRFLTITDLQMKPSNSTLNVCAAVGIRINISRTLTVC